MSAGIRVTLSRSELRDLADVYFRRAEDHERGIEEYGDEFAEQKKEWAAEASANRQRAEALVARSYGSPDRKGGE